METRYAKRKKHLYCKSYEVSAEDDRNGEKDRISDLPYEIVHRIFSFLPLEYAAKTCVLSKRWKYLWYSYPCLDFSTAFDSSFERDFRISGIDSAHQKRCDRIDVVLRSLDKHWDVRILKLRGLRDASAIVRSMRLAVKHNVQDLDLDFFPHGCFDLPRCIINSLSLRDLRLKSRCAGLRLPPLNPMKICFKSLQSLYLSGADFSNQSPLLNLFTDSLFPSLVKLHLQSCQGMENLRIQVSGLKDLYLENFEIQELDISAKKLEKLSVTDCLVTGSRVAIDAPLLEVIIWVNDVTGGFVIGKCDSLKEATVNFYPIDEDLSDSQLRGISDLLNGISPCRSLTLDVSVFEILSRSNHLAGVQPPCVFNRLTSLELKLGYQDDVNWDEDTEDYIYWESQAHSLNLFLRHLKVVKVVWFKECSNDVGLVKLLLNNGEVLEQLLLLEHKYFAVGEKTRSDIMEFPRASSNVDIIFR